MGFSLQRSQSWEVALGYKRMQVDSGNKGELYVCVRGQSSCSMCRRGVGKVSDLLPTQHRLARLPYDLKRIFSLQAVGKLPV